MELFINRLNNAIKANKEVKFYFRKEIFNILKLLKEKNYLSYRAYLCEDKHDSNKNYWKLEITRARFSKLILKSKGSRSIVISYRQLLSVKEAYILSTNLGYLTVEEAIRYKVGGIIVFKIEGN